MMFLSSMPLIIHETYLYQDSVTAWERVCISGNWWEVKKGYKHLLENSGKGVESGRQWGKWASHGK